MKKQEGEEQRNYASIVREYLELDENAQAAMSFNQFYSARRSDERQHRGNRDLQHKINKLSLPTFDGSGKMTARSWIQKLDTYFSLSPMTEEEAIKFAILHLEDLAHEWWHHGIVTQEFGQVNSYADFTQKWWTGLTGKIRKHTSKS